MEEKLSQLAQELRLDYGFKMRSLYATDASVYRELPLAVAFPKNEKELQRLVHFALENNTSLIPRAAGTSLAGQCVGEGIVVDTSRYFTNILEVNVEKRWVKVQPGVIRDDLNRFLEEYGLFFSPNTSTSNRCMIGGMVGNNSSGSTSIRYGVTRDKVKELKCVLSDGSVASFKAETQKTFNQLITAKSFVSKIHEEVFALLKPDEVRMEVEKEFPDQKVTRRNTGYAVDEFIKNNLYDNDLGHFDLNKLLCGSEGTLALTTEITLNLDPLPPKLNAMVIAHFDSIEKSLEAVVPVMKHRLYACELMDKTILDCTQDNLQQRKNRFFIQGDPESILMLEVKADNKEDLNEQVSKLKKTISDSGLCYAESIIYGKDIKRAFELRKAGLGALANLSGNSKAVACIEDTAVAIEDLSSYIKDFTDIMNGFGQKAIYYAHAGAGEIHLRPILDLKSSKDRLAFRKISNTVAFLVKKYDGSLSGEHGDGRVRAEFIPEVLGEKNYDILVKLKNIFDPKNIFNPGKIVNAAPMDEQLRYEADAPSINVTTFLDFRKEDGILNLAEKCNGSGDCRKSPEAGGGMCPSYHVTKNEQDTTRGRANMLREILTHGDGWNRFDSQELKEVFDLCVSCKACAIECPSNVDVSILKAEFLHQFQKSNGRTIRAKAFANNYRINKALQWIKPYSNLMMSSGFFSGLMKKSLGIAKQRSLPLLSGLKLKKELALLKSKHVRSDKKVYLFLDEFSSMLEVGLIVKSIELLHHLGYEVLWCDHEESGRGYLSKGFLPEAQKIAVKNVEVFSKIISDELPLIGIEPSCILSFRDEYLRLVEDKETAKNLAKNCFLIEEFLCAEMDKGNITASQFDEVSRDMKIHVHCHQKALSKTDFSLKILSLPMNHQVELIESGCCGMAGSFGYEKEHYEISMKMAEVSLLPSVRIGKGKMIVANGTSCRHQIDDGAGVKARHPVEILWIARNKNI